MQLAILKLLNIDSTILMSPQAGRITLIVGIAFGSFFILFWTIIIIFAIKYSRTKHLIEKKAYQIRSGMTRKEINELFDDKRIKCSSYYDLDTFYAKFAGNYYKVEVSYSGDVVSQVSRSSRKISSHY
jgi:hypothetical protein